MMGNFRELGFGVLFFTSALAGAFLGAGFWSSRIGSSVPEEKIEWIIQGAIGGTFIGGGAWLVLKHRFLTPLKTSSNSRPLESPGQK